MLMYVRQPTQTGLPCATAFDPESYCARLSAKLAEHREFVNPSLSSFSIALEIYLWQTLHDTAIQDWLPCVARNTNWKEDGFSGGRVESYLCQESICVEITNRKRTGVVHINRLHPHHQATWSKAKGSENTLTPDGLPSQWSPPWIEHMHIPTEAPKPQPAPRYPRW